MLKIQQGFYSLLLATVCSASYAVTPAPVDTTTPVTTLSPSMPAAVKATANEPVKSNESASATKSVYADTPIGDAPVTETKDPYEGFNRAMFNFNETVDKYLMKPIATGYNAIMPKPLNLGIHNFFNNLGTLPTLANDLLQFNFYQAANDSWRLFINTTVGIGGLFDIGSRIGLKYYENDFGLTLASWGYDNSNYLVLPFLGPSTPRDGVFGAPVDYFVFSVYPHVYPKSTRYQLFGLWVVDRRAQLLKYQNVLDEAAVDKYVFIRNAAMQRRKHQIEVNQHLGYDERETTQEPVADLSQAEVDASLIATAEPVEPVSEPIVEGKAANAVTTQPATAAQAVTSATPAPKPAASGEASAG